MRCCYSKSFLLVELSNLPSYMLPFADLQAIRLAYPIRTRSGDLEGKGKKTTLKHAAAAIHVAGLAPLVPAISI